MKAAYVVVDAMSLVELEQKVTKFLDDGYLPAGGMYHAQGEGNMADGTRIAYDMWLQAVYKIG